MDTMEKANRTVEHLAKTSADSYKTVIDHVVAQQERNVKFAREIFDGTAREIRHQAESNRALGQELIERAEQQRDAFQTLIGESADVYRDLLSTPLSLSTIRACGSSRTPIAPRFPSPATTS